MQYFVPHLEIPHEIQKDAVLPITYYVYSDPEAVIIITFGNRQIVIGIQYTNSIDDFFP